MRIIKIICIVFFFFLSSCYGIKERKTKIRLGIPPRVSFMPVFLAVEKNFFKKNGLDIELIQNEKINELYSEKKIDMLCTGLTEAIIFSSEGHATQIVYRFSYSLANDIVVASSNIKSLKDLKNKKISFDGVNSSSHIFVQQLLSRQGILEGDYFAVNIPVAQVIFELEKGTIDAGHTSGVGSLEIIKKGLNVIGKSSDNPNLLSDTLSVDADFLEKHPAEVGKLIKSINEANQFYATNSKDSVSILAKKLDKTNQEIEEELKGIKFLSLEENIQSLKITEIEIANSNSQGITQTGNLNQVPKFNPMDNSIVVNPLTHAQTEYTPVRDKSGFVTAGETIIQFLRERGQLYRMPDLKSIINDSFVKSQDR